MIVTTELVLFIIGIFTAIFTAGGTVWWRMETKIAEAKAQGDKACEALQVYKLHVAETYATKSGMTEQTASLTKSINDNFDRMDAHLDRLTERLDRIMDNGGSQRRQLKNTS